MKKRIIAAALAAVLVFNFCTSVRPRAAAGGVVVITAIGVLAWQLIGVMSGQYDDTANAIGVFIESGVDGITNSDSPFQKTWRTGWQSMCNTISGWVSNGTATLDDEGKLHLDYNQYLELYGQVVSVMEKPSVEFKSSYDYVFLDFDLDSLTSFAVLPRIDAFFNTSSGQCYAPIYYNDEMLIFGTGYVYQSHPNDSSYQVACRYLTSDSKYANIGGIAGSSESYADFVSTYQPIFKCRYNETFCQVYIRNDNRQFSKSIDSCFVYKNGTITKTPVAQIHFTSFKSGLVTTTGDYSAFIKSITGYTAVNNAPDLDDLADVLPLDKTTNPGLVVDSDPSIVLPTDAVTVTDVPGVDDATLTEYMTKTETDIDVPSIIIQKFPFCIPYDFIRIIGVFCADPKPPVFRIPISTNPDNLTGFDGNQTFGEYLPDEGFTPMFEIDEEIVIDLSALPLVQPICYAIFIIGFVVLLIFLTPKLIQH